MSFATDQHYFYYSLIVIVGLAWRFNYRDDTLKTRESGSDVDPPWLDKRTFG